jgi:hypothetical protein
MGILGDGCDQHTLEESQEQSAGNDYLEDEFYDSDNSLKYDW